MARLTIDLGLLEQTIKDYETSVQDFTDMKKNLDNAIEELKSSGWVSGASAQYFLTYEDRWSKNMEMHIKILKHLETCLNEAKSDYDKIYNEIPNLGTDL